MLAAVLHVAAFFFILIDNTRPELRHQVRTSVTLDDAATATTGSADDAYWDKLTDPRLYILPQPESVRPPLPAMALEPGPIQLPSVPLPAPAEVASFPFLNQPLPTLAERVQAALRPERQPFAYQEKPPLMAHRTTLAVG